LSAEESGVDRLSLSVEDQLLVALAYWHYYEQRYQERLLNNLKKKAQSLGFDLVAQSPVAECVS
jgi:hypothetical protein